MNSKQELFDLQSAQYGCGYYQSCCNDDLIAQNQLFNAIQKCRVDVDIMINKKKTVDEDTIKSAQALARDIQWLRKSL